MKDRPSKISFLRNERKSCVDRRINRTLFALLAICLYSAGSTSFLLLNNQPFLTGSPSRELRDKTWDEFKEKKYEALTKLKAKNDQHGQQPSIIIKETKKNKEEKEIKQKTQKVEKKSTCDCVKCDTDMDCGQLWTGNQYSILPGNEPKVKGRINTHLVISHCKSDLGWVSNVTKYLENVESIHVITKCGYPVTGVPDMTTIEVLPNVGRCDHTYAYYINNVLDNKLAEKQGEEGKPVVLFLKDDISLANKHHIGSYDPIESLVQVAASANGFKCRLSPGSDYETIETRTLKYFSTPGPARNYSSSTYHDTPTLMKFKLKEYERNVKGYENNTAGIEFSSNFTNLGAFVEALGKSPLQEVVPVCYGGVFAASVSNIKKRNPNVWRRLEHFLSRGNNIEEGHFAERLWASFLSPSLESYKLKALWDYAENVSNRFAVKGSLLKPLDDEKTNKWLEKHHFQGILSKTHNVAWWKGLRRRK